MELHPYDGVERRFRHTDADRAVGLGLVARLLHLASPPTYAGVLYDLSFYSGGIGIIDMLAITLPADRTLSAGVVNALGAQTPEAAAHDPGWADDFIWLIGDEDAPIAARDAAVQFINSERRDFQSICHGTNHIFFVAGSNVNSWIALWADDTRLNYYGYDQG